MRKKLFSWAFYDFANTIFSAIVLTTYFPLYLTEMAGANWYLGAATTTSMILAGLVIPLIGALSDKTGKTKKYLVLTTLLSILFMALLTTFRSPFLLVLTFLFACFFYHSSLVFYNSLLPVIAPPEKQGFASGLGTGLGYLGVITAVPIAHWVDEHLGRPYVFSAGALLFLIFALPLFFFVPERPVDNPIQFRWGLWREEWNGILKTIKSLRNQPALLLFLGGNFFAVDALNSTIFWVAVYAREVFQATSIQLVHLVLGINLFAFLTGIFFGLLTDRFGAMRMMIISAGLLVVTLFGLGMVRDFPSFMAVCMLGGASAIAGIWTSGRKALIEFAPKSKVGEYFGLYGLTTKISVLGSLIFSILADWVGFRPALLALIFPASVGFLLLIFSKLILSKKFVAI